MLWNKGNVKDTILSYTRTNISENTWVVSYRLGLKA